MRKGYFHALEGVIAALIVVVYLTSIVQVPETTDWDDVHLAKESEDVLTALDRSGDLDRILLRNDKESLNTLLNTLDSSLSYHIGISGLPQPVTDVGILVNESETYEKPTTPGNWTTPGVFALSEHGYRKGNLSGPNFGSVPFQLLDRVENNYFKYTAAYFDFNNNGIYTGPFNVSDRFCRDNPPRIQGCYELGPFNTTLRLYNASQAANLDQDIGNTSLNTRFIDLQFGMVNLADQEPLLYDALLTDWNTSTLAAHEPVIDRYLRQGNTLVITADVAETQVDTSYLQDLGFSYLDAAALLDPDAPDTNVLYSPHGPGNTSYRPNNYYLDTAIEVRDTADRGSYTEAVLTLRGQDIRANISGGTVSFQTEDFAIPYEEGSRVQLVGNPYYITALRPLTLRPAGQQQFTGFNTARIDADYHATRLQHTQYNTSDADAAANISSRYQNRSDIIPSSYSQGVVGTDCAFDTYPYKRGFINVSSSNITFLLVNFEVAAPCDSYYEFLYLDLRQDADFNDNSDETPLGFSGEGPYQFGDTVQINNASFEVNPFFSGNGTSLNRVGPRIVGEVPVSQSAVNDNGATILFGRRLVGDDDMHLLQSLLLAETEERTDFTQVQDLGETAIGYNYLAETPGENPTPYTLHTVWWFN